MIRDIVDFGNDRDWAQFHTPRNLAAALAIEVAELQELMLWKTDSQTSEFLATPPGRREATHEVADVLIYALLFCSALNIDPIEAIKCKLSENARKYPIDASRGNAIKYTQLGIAAREDKSKNA